MAVQKGFFSLPAELRNGIYELVFASDNISEPVNLLDAAPPSAALLLTSRQLYNETAQIYRESYKSYWLNTFFTVNNRFNPVTSDDLRRIEKFEYEDLQHICRLKLLGRRKHGRGDTIKKSTIVLVDASGIWKRTVTSQNFSYSTINQETWIVPSGHYWDVKIKRWKSEASARAQCNARDFRMLPLSGQIRAVVALDNA